jgi:GPH family glycoside/pentoside/hexuronide:cation symporter
LYNRVDQAAEATVPPRLGLARLAIFSSPVLVFQAIELPWRTYLPAFFSETLGLKLAVVGALLMWIRLFDMAADPIVGWASDRFPTRFGSRRPWLAASVPLIMVGTWQVFFAQPGISLAALAAWCVVMHVGYTLMITPHGGWGLEISGDTHERTRIMGGKVWFAAIGMPFTILLPAILEHFYHASHAVQVQAMGLMLIVLAPLSAFLVLRFIPEPRVAGDVANGAVDPLRQFATILKNPALVTILLLYALVGLADAASTATFLFFVEQGLGLAGWASTLLLVPALSALVAIPLWAWASQRWGKRRALTGVFAWQALIMPFAFLLPTGGLGWMMAFLVLRSLSFGADYMLLRSMVADVSADDVERHGARNGGSYYALFNVSLKLAAGLGVGIALAGLGWAGFVPGKPASAGALFALRLCYTLPGLVAGLVGVAILVGIAPRARIAPQRALA